MTSYNTSIMGREYKFISVLEREVKNIPQILSNIKKETVVLSPSVKSDFSVSVYTADAKKEENFIFPLVLAADFLISKRGLPLSEIEFEASCGALKIFNTVQGVYNINAPKCKQIFSKTTEFMGCKIKYTDVILDRLYRVLFVDNPKLFDIENLIGLIRVDNEMPSVSALATVDGNNVSFTSYNAHMKRVSEQPYVCLGVGYAIREMNLAPTEKPLRFFGGRVELDFLSNFLTFTYKT